jgi:hypothetical protein
MLWVNVGLPWMSRPLIWVALSEAVMCRCVTPALSGFRGLPCLRFPEPSILVF